MIGRRALPVAAVLMLGGCLNGAFNTTRDIDVLEDTSQFRMAPVSRAYVLAPEALLMLQRRLGGAVEQRIALPNFTTVPGDNMLVVRAQTSQAINVNTFQLEEFLARMDGPPPPFSEIDDSALQTGEDDLGPYFYAERRVGVDTLCVLVLRRITQAARPLPEGAGALDVMLRNCVQGTTQDAMEPISGRRLAAAPVSGGDPRNPSFYTLSPHAAPQGTAERTR
ncbi:hypothetical protein C2I36_10195 [Rhodobacteraceae bacterium WD3A24]|nr:hypothetical protein C2I36_10195 [Rhodobacteraceae bacterium WD3A24]